MHPAVDATCDAVCGERLAPLNRFIVLTPYNRTQHKKRFFYVQKIDNIRQPSIEFTLVQRLLAFHIRWKYVFMFLRLITFYITVDNVVIWKCVAVGAFSIFRLYVILGRISFYYRSSCARISIEKHVSRVSSGYGFTLDRLPTLLSRVNIIYVIEYDLIWHGTSVRFKLSPGCYAILFRVTYRCWCWNVPALTIVCRWT